MITIIGKKDAAAVQEASGKVSICDVKKEGNQVVLVDDGSGEDKQQEFWKLSEYAIVLHHEQNRGKGTAIKTALKFIQESLWDYDVVGIMDKADFEGKILRQIIDSGN